MWAPPGSVREWSEPEAHAAADYGRAGGTSSQNESMPTLVCTNERLARFVSGSIDRRVRETDQ